VIKVARHHLKMINRQYLLVKLSLVFFSFTGIALATTVLAANEDNVGGFGYSFNTGWISFNDDVVDGAPSPNPAGGTYDYGVGINEVTGAMSGYAWSADTVNSGALEGIGWISFNAADVNGCNGCSGAACLPTVDTVPDGSGNHAVTGWARAISACKDNLWNGSNCTGGGAGDLAGGWDGCLKFKNSYIDSNGDFYGWMTSSADLTTGVVGWVNLNSANCTGSNCIANVSYKVHTSAKFGPSAGMECGGTCTGGYCDTDPDSTWEMFAPTGPGTCSGCTFTISNTSVGDECTKWELVNGSGNVVYESGPWDGGQNLTFGASVPTGDYKLRLRVSNLDRLNNNNDCSEGTIDIEEHDIKIKREVSADFMCTLDDPSVIVDPVWLDCESAGFKKKVLKGEKIFVRDSASLSKHSEESEDGSVINSHIWTFTIDGDTVDGGTGDSASFTAGKNNTLTLEAGDNASRSNCKIIDFSGKSLPKWQEVNPVSMFLNGLYADLSKIFTVIAN
jgi:hypothetical protein